MPAYTTLELFDLSKTMAEALLVKTTYPWEILPEIGTFIRRIGAALPAALFHHPAEDVWIAKNAAVASTAFIGGPCIIDEGAEIRHCAFIRQNALVGKGAVVGNSTELKNVILFDGVQVPHFNYVGDAVLGHKAHLGAGVIVSNVRGDRLPVVVHSAEEDLPTGLKKFGALVGDFSEVGCNSVLNPGCVLGRHSVVYPVSSVRGTVPAGYIYKDATHIEPKKEVKLEVKQD